MTLDIIDTPPQTSKRTRLVKFSRADMTAILLDHCRANGMELSGKEDVSLLIDDDERDYINGNVCRLRVTG